MNLCIFHEWKKRVTTTILNHPCANIEQRQCVKCGKRERLVTDLSNPYKLFG